MRTEQVVGLLSLEPGGIVRGSREALMHSSRAQRPWPRFNVSDGKINSTVQEDSTDSKIPADMRQEFPKSNSEIPRSDTFFQSTSTRSLYK